MNMIFANPRFAPGMNFLIDRRAADPIPDTAYAEVVARYYRAHREQFGRCAVVVSGLLAFGMSRITDGYCLDDCVQTFDDLENAQAWLAEEGVPCSPLATTAPGFAGAS
jgi:hypothetical protein